MKEHKLAAIVFTDIVGYTSRMEADELKTMQLLTRQREIIFPIAKEYGGEVIKEIGDGLLMMFTSANQAVRFAISVQEKLKDEELAIRAGIHIGDVIFEGGDVFGSAVNIAARIEPLATSGGICISEDVRSQIRNKGDILTASIGKKELKGVNESMEIYRIMTGEMTAEPFKISFFRDLWQRRVFQATALYLMLAFLIRLSMAYFVKEYLLSPHLTDLVWYILLSLIPSILLVSYFHGKKEAGKWSRVELIGMPVNAVVALLVIFFVFKGKDLGAATTRVTLQDEEGKSIEKVVFKNEFRKKILIFNIKNISASKDLDYLQYSLPLMAEFDLSQDLLITPDNSMNIYQDIVDAGYENATGLPVTLMKKFAEKRHMNYFLSGEFDKKEDQFIIHAKLYDTQLARLVSEIEVQDVSLFGLVDKLTVEIKKSIDLPESHISGTTDLPVAEIFTSSEKALSYFTKASLADAQNNWEENVKFIDLAIQEDPGFALAYVVSAISHFNSNEIEKAQQDVTTAMDLLYKLPERQQFSVKYVYYVLNQQAENAMNIVKMWVELCPDDLTAHSTLAMRYGVSNMIPEAIEQCKEILRLDPEQYQFLDAIGQLYLEMGYFDSSLVYYQAYTRALPQQADSYQNLGDYYYIVGEMDLANENYEKALVLSDVSEAVPIKIALGLVMLKTGQFDLAEKQFADALASSRTALDSASAFEAFYKLHIKKGQAKEALEYFEKKIDRLKLVLAPKNLIAFRIFNIDHYIDAGAIDRAIAVMNEISVQLKPPIENVAYYGYMMIYAETGQTEKAKEAVALALEVIEDFGEEILIANIYYAQGKIHESHGEYTEAIENYNQFIALQPTYYSARCYTARCYGRLKDIKKAESEIDIALKHLPYDPVVNYEAALVFLDMDKKDEGKDCLERAVDIWKDADSDYEKARLAREKLASL